MVINTMLNSIVCDMVIVYSWYRILYNVVFGTDIGRQVLGRLNVVL